MAAFSSGVQDIVVWEWEEDNGEWIPYDPVSCRKVERVHQSGWLNKIVISMQSMHRVSYEIDLSMQRQKNQDSGKFRAIRRSLFPSTSSLAQGNYWEWCKQSRKGHKRWTPYSVKASEEIERHFGRRSSFKFPSHFNMPYEIDFKAKSQVNFITGYKRSIRRSCNTDKYPLDTTGGGSLHNGAPYTTGSTYPHPATRSAGYPYLGQTSNLPGSYGSSLPPSQQLGYPTPSSSNFGLTSSLPGSSWSHPQHSLYTNLGTPSSFPGYNSTSQVSSSVRPFVPSTSITPATSTATSGASKKRKKRKPVHIPPCPAGGIPSNAGASTATVPVTQVLTNFTKKIDVDSKSTDQCAICQSNLTEHSGFGNSKETRELSLCQHVFHTECLEASYSHGVKNGCIVCPACNKMHGIKTGNQPDGIMRYSHMSSTVPGFSGCGTLRVEYHILPGVQKAEHPNPGSGFSTPGFPRIGYLPDNDDGRRVLLLLIEAWKRRLIFTVGQSTTSGKTDCVTWTGIHHKTEIHSKRGHGYPDDTYLDRVTAELEAEGVIEQ